MPLVPSSDPPDEADPVRCATFPRLSRATTTISPSEVAAPVGAVHARSASRARVDPPAGLARVPSRASARLLTPPAPPSRPPPPPPAGPARFFDWCRQPPPVITAPRPVPPGGGFGAYSSPGGHHARDVHHRERRRIHPVRVRSPHARRSTRRSENYPPPRRTAGKGRSLSASFRRARPRSALAPPPRVYAHHPLPSTSILTRPLLRPRAPRPQGHGQRAVSRAGRGVETVRRARAHGRAEIVPAGGAHAARLPRRRPELAQPSPAQQVHDKFEDMVRRTPNPTRAERSSTKNSSAVSLGGFKPTSPAPADGPGVAPGTRTRGPAAAGAAAATERTRARRG